MNLYFRNLFFDFREFLFYDIVWLCSLCELEEILQNFVIFSFLKVPSRNFVSISSVKRVVFGVRFFFLVHLPLRKPTGKKFLGSCLLAKREIFFAMS